MLGLTVLPQRCSVARSSVRFSRDLVTLLEVTEAKLKRHFVSAADILRDHIVGDSAAKLITEWKHEVLLASLVGTEGEYARRHRGPGKTAVARALRLGKGLWAWISYREAWDSARQAGKTRRYSFRSAGLTIHLGYRYNQYKPQMLRTEWTIAGANYKPRDSANPHWHFDALESLRRDDAAQRADEVLATLRRNDEAAEPRDFSPPVNQNDVRDVVSVQKLSKLHLASAAAWWKGDSASHVHSPTSVDDIQAWVKGALEHLAGELERLATHP